ncbi:MAG: hypothetical protein GY953_10940 [bacterium]|nr:hypothetical protein [bacterium]
MPRLIVTCLLLLSLPATVAQTTVAFPDGVASGDVTHSRAVLWTRTDRSATLTLEISEDPAFQNVIRRSARASDDNGLTAKLVLHFLKPEQTYYYRWKAGGSLSETGTFHTAPIPFAPRNVRFTYGGDSDGTRVNGVPAVNNFEALDAARNENGDFFIYLGDIVYTDSGHRPGGRATTIDDFRETYHESRRMPALRELQRATSIYPVWDDHEVGNDWNPETVDPFLFANGRRAFVENMPVSPPVTGIDPTCIQQPFFRYIRWGSEVDIIILDERSCRGPTAELACLLETGEPDQAPLAPALFRSLAGIGQGPPPGCVEALSDPSRTLLGATQKYLLKTYLRYSTARFKFIVNEVTIQQYFALPYDRWEGYAAGRAEILNFIRDNRIENVIFLTADAEPIATEFITGPIATTTLEQTLDEAGFSQGLQNQALNLLGLSCWDLGSFGYGLVEVDIDAGTATVTLKDDNGDIIHSQGDPEVRCTKTFESR